MLAPVLVTPPEVLPVSLADVKASMHVEHDEDDSILTALIGAATTYLDGWRGILGRCLVEQTWRQDYECAKDRLYIPLGPVTEIVEVLADGEVVLPATYECKRDAGGRDYLEFSSTPHGEISVTYKAGAPVIPAPPQDSPVSTVEQVDRLAIIIFVKMNYLPLKPDDRASYQRTFDALTGANRKVFV